MNELLLRRRIAIINSTPSLPYDAEIEYLESSGTQYLVIIGNNALYGFDEINSDFYFEIDCQFLRVPTSSYTGNGLTTNSYQFFYALNSSNNTGLYMSYNGKTDIASKLSVDKTLRHKVKVSSVNGIVTYNFDNTNVGMFNLVSFPLKYFYLFVLSQQNGSLNGLMPPQRIFSTKLSVGGVDYFDLIPVRVGTTGYMYDKISGNLFGNSGTGDFILGNDVN